ncbi:hypothetical protein [Agromyces archimandritae]|uniref:LPXTG cell wall anchor domain-containing protein n=1 Tax=Agromyces archimandritae TaxID=2781962 RepID=A0A975FK68_9MICO|nr:hypothetical protein [Agromyces archimandritae]QTX03432.1 hypothetical protein G127AT_08620 [Agromyces archimandritae]
MPLTLPGRRFGALAAAATIALFAFSAAPASAEEPSIVETFSEPGDPNDTVDPPVDEDEYDMGDPNDTPDFPPAPGGEPGDTDYDVEENGDPVEPGEEEPVEQIPVFPPPVIEVGVTEFVEGGWGDGIPVRGSGFNPAIPDVAVQISAGQGTVGLYWFPVEPDGTIDVVVHPVDPLYAFPGMPRIELRAWQPYPDWSTVYSDAVELTILPAGLTNPDTGSTSSPTPAAPAAPTAPAETPKAPAAAVAKTASGLPETGIDTGIGGVAFALLVSGAFVLLAARRRASAS